MSYQILYAAIATLITWLFTALGAGIVVFYNKVCNKYYGIMLGFASGVMIAASFWSLLQPAIEMSKGNIIKCLFVFFSFLFGCIFMIFSDKTIKILQNRSKNKKIKTIFKNKDLFMLVYSITIHNIPEGLAVGVAFGAIKNINSKECVLPAIIIAIGIAVQNFPEGAAISIPIRAYGYSKIKSFVIGQASALVEPLFGIIGAILVVYTKWILPFSLAFAAGCMIYVVVSELIPNTINDDNKSTNYLPPFFTVVGFCIMMALDVLM